MINNNLQGVICRYSLHNKKRKFDDAIVMNCLNCSRFSLPFVNKNPAQGQWSGFMSKYMS